MLQFILSRQSFFGRTPANIIHCNQFVQATVASGNFGQKRITWWFREKFDSEYMTNTKTYDIWKGGWEGKGAVRAEDTWVLLSPLHVTEQCHCSVLLLQAGYN